MRCLLLKDAFRHAPDRTGGAGRDTNAHAYLMLSYLLQRLGLALVTCLFISALTFLIIRLPPGDFVDAYIAT